MSAQIHSALFDPPLSEPIKTLDIPVAGHGYNILALIFNVVCNANGIPFADLKATAKDAKLLQNDPDGKDTIGLLRNVQNLLELVTGTSARTIGPHPAVYFYTRSGAFQPAALLATAELLADLERENKLIEFTRIRKWFEGFITENKEFISVIVHKHGSGARSVAPISEFLKWLANQMMAAKEPSPEIWEHLNKSKFAYLTRGEAYDTSNATSGAFHKNTKSAAFLRDALDNPIRCNVCGAMVHSKSMHFDHLVPRRDGGKATLENARITHPYCDSTVKDALAKA
jgi:hypothetical protein